MEIRVVVFYEKSFSYFILYMPDKLMINIYTCVFTTISLFVLQYIEFLLPLINLLFPFIRNSHVLY